MNRGFAYLYNKNISESKVCTVSCVNTDAISIKNAIVSVCKQFNITVSEISNTPFKGKFEVYDELTIPLYMTDTKGNKYLFALQLVKKCKC